MFDTLTPIGPCRPDFLLEARSRSTGEIRQIVVEAMMWPVSQVRDAARFNEELLRTHRLFPLSTLGIETIDGEAVYIMFGALDAHSRLASLMFEIETLAENVLGATDAFAGYLLPAESAA